MQQEFTATVTDYLGEALPFFPFDEIRPNQVEAIEFTLDKVLKEGKKFVILELGTGVGKSAIAVAVAKYWARKQALNGADPGGFFLTTQKILQEQYLRDFGGIKGDMVSIKSAANYECKRAKGQSCGAVRRFIKKNKSDKDLQKCFGDCKYLNAKTKWMNSALSITNYSYFLNITKYTNDVEVPRQLLILDECHNVEQEISGFVDIQIDTPMCNKVDLNLPSFSNEAQSMRWIDDVFEPRITSRVADLEAEMDYSPDASIINEHEFMDKYMCKLHRFQEMYTTDNWIMNQDDGDAHKHKKLEFKPIDISGYSQETLFKYGQVVIFLSATVIDAKRFAQQVGIPTDLVASLQIESPFPVKNKPIIYAPQGKMNLDTINETLPKIALAVAAILKRHPNEKGIIHTHSYKILNYLMKNVRDKRLLFQDDKNKEKIISKHMTTTEPTVLVSPSMSEGVDLKGNLSRFQVICKLPFPYLGDKLVQKRKEKWDWWYSYETAKVIIQSTGRSIRDENDYAVTYVLDEAWAYFWKMNSHLFPPSFHKQFK